MDLDAVSPIKSPVAVQSLQAKQNVARRPFSGAMPNPSLERQDDAKKVEVMLRKLSTLVVEL